MFGLWKIGVRKCCKPMIDVFSWQKSRINCPNDDLKDKIEHPKSLGYIAGYLRAFLEQVGVTIDQNQARYALQYTLSSVFGEHRGNACFEKFVFYSKIGHPDLSAGLDAGYKDFFRYMGGDEFSIENWKKIVERI